MSFEGAMVSKFKAYEKQLMSAMGTAIPILSNGPFELEQSPSKSDVVLNLKSNSEVMTAKEVSVFLRLSLKTIYKYARQGAIPRAPQTGDTYRFLRSEVMEWARNNRA